MQVRRGRHVFSLVCTASEVSLTLRWEPLKAHPSRRACPFTLSFQFQLSIFVCSCLGAYGLLQIGYRPCMISMGASRFLGGLEGWRAATEDAAKRCWSSKLCDLTLPRQRIWTEQHFALLIFGVDLRSKRICGLRLGGVFFAGKHSTFDL